MKAVKYNSDKPRSQKNARYGRGRWYIANARHTVTQKTSKKSDADNSDLVSENSNTQNRTKAACRRFENAHCAALFRRLLCTHKTKHEISLMNEDYIGSCTSMVEKIIPS